MSTRDCGRLMRASRSTALLLRLEIMDKTAQMPATMPRNASTGATSLIQTMANPHTCGDARARDGRAILSLVFVIPGPGSLPVTDARSRFLVTTVLLGRYARLAWFS